MACAAACSGDFLGSLRAALITKRMPGALDFSLLHVTLGIAYFGLDMLHKSDESFLNAVEALYVHGSFYTLSRNAISSYPTPHPNPNPNPKPDCRSH